MSPRLSALLLAGGASSRMGFDKASLADPSGRTLWQKQFRTLQQLAPAELLVTGPLRDEAVSHECIPIEDAVPGAGPLGGIVAGLRRCIDGQLIVLAVDMPGMSAAFLQELVCSSAGRSLVPVWNGRFEPLAAVYHASALPVFEECLRTGELSLQEAIGTLAKQRLVDTRIVSEKEAALFVNYNTPSDVPAEWQRDEGSRSP